LEAGPDWLAEGIILLGQLLAEELLDPGEESNGSAAEVGFHSIKVT